MFKKRKQNQKNSLNKILSKSILIFGLFCCFNFWLTSKAQAATITWDGSDSTDWATGTNWIGDAAPTATDDVVIDGSYTNAPTLNLSGGITTINSYNFV